VGISVTIEANTGDCGSMCVGGGVSVWCGFKCGGKGRARDNLAAFGEIMCVYRIVICSDIIDEIASRARTI
jgi:hypothetical protein